MIHDPTRHHQFVMLFEIKNASPASLSSLSNPLSLAQDVRYGLVMEEALRQALNLYLQQKLALPILKNRSPLVLDFSPESKNALCKQYYNLRMFGVTDSAGRTLIPGPVRLSLARSIDPIFPLSSGRNTAYGLYRMHGYYHPNAGKENGVNASDLESLWQGLSNLFTSGTTSWPVASAMRGLWIFTHETSPAEPIRSRELFNLVQTPALRGQAGKFEDYTIHYPPPGHLEAVPGVCLTYLA
ncbi:type I CRISPR-associated protein Cas7 [uncultured Meiothermus sp.]|jgi:CRISPR-associated protein Csd2|uniref:type I CRISPR-associated protein Cas7 n=1 Tax=uncultured Meiothermus sp. TaxID=157471 RepID=UPI00261D245D|nr:type I CRISPR-associated protein Cas7 [uncultured Meiothermus sp.]